MPRFHHKDDEITEWNRDADEEAPRGGNVAAQTPEEVASADSADLYSGRGERGAAADGKLISSIVFVAVILGGAALPGNWRPAIYALSFWHYYVYWLAYRFGAVPLAEFKRHAVALKIVSLLALGSVYLAAPLDLVSLLVIASGFLLNALAAKALGSDRTYYGYEVAGLSRRMVTAFPYSYISHPMLVGNIAAFGGALLNPEFRRLWWPLAAAHVALNVGLLVMEVAVPPLRLGASLAPTGTRRNGWLKGGLLALVGAALGGVWAAACGGAMALGASLGVWIAIHAFVIYRRYLPAAAIPAGQRGIPPNISL